MTVNKMRLTPWEICANVDAVVVDGPEQRFRSSAEVVDAIGIVQRFLERLGVFVLDGESVFGDEDWEFVALCAGRRREILSTSAI